MSGQHPAAQDGKGIDREHQVQLRLMQALAASLTGGGESAPLLAQLTDYSCAHFLSEELLMRLYAYPEYEEHVLDHERMIERLDEIASRPDGRESRLHAVNELTAQLLRHIGSRDKRLHDFLDEL